MNETSYTLLQLNNLVKGVLKESFSETIWVTGEIHEMNANPSGHCYLELVEKAEKSDQIIARAKATIWVMTWRMLKPYFETATGQEMQSGLKVMVNVSVEFHELYGYSLNIKDIDPIYTLGDLEKKKAEIIRQLEEEGVFDMNKSLDLEPVPQRIAVISSKSAAGYQDFLHQIETNPFGYKFSINLFDAVMQGKQAEASILTALDKIYSRIKNFDTVVLIRGGGSKSDLNCFNSYLVASHIAQFPLPVITGIGHERDTTIADLVAHTRMKTPTAVAEFLISHMEDFETTVIELENQLHDLTAMQIDQENQSFFQLVNRMHPAIRSKMTYENNLTTRYLALLPGLAKNYLFRNSLTQKTYTRELRNLPKTFFLAAKDQEKQYRFILKNLAKSLLEKESYKLKYKEDTTQMHHPDQILRRGFAIVSRNGKMIKSAKTLKKSDNIETKFSDGRIESIVEKVRFSD
jgi:exodeoxyribonuclease VII large subunit